MRIPSLKMLIGAIGQSPTTPTVYTTEEIDYVVTTEWSDILWLQSGCLGCIVIITARSCCFDACCRCDPFAEVQRLLYLQDQGCVYILHR